VKFVRMTPSVNGKHEASPKPSGASAIAPKPTVFPQDHPRLSVRTLLYYASRYHLGSAAFLRWLLLLLGATGVVWATGWFPGHWWITALNLLLLIGVLALFHYWRRCDFVRFAATTPPALPAKILLPQEKVAVMVTGFFGVEKKYQRFTWLPGFYRSFATREHVLICQVRQQPWAWLGRWPEDEVGLWYIFCLPQDIRRIEWGQLAFGADIRPAIALTHRVTVTKPRRFRAEQIRDETAYIAFEHVASGEAIWADLQHDFPNGIPQTV